MGRLATVLLIHCMACCPYCPRNEGVKGGKKQKKKEKFFDVNHKDEEGSTPLHKAAFNGHADVLRFLMQQVAITVYVCARERDCVGVGVLCRVFIVCRRL